ncbi:hypothetical protein A1359_10450 [Methylomonas lenta]|uniref:Uncharacterized protein n=1 Tax=Methylomonas lenta TaxID=980561 RepID=A0A177N970_9GAMM|nr:glycosyltransferase family 1 protein [Methylomonas lenta]OAI14487.1 hypothetical protein A1359_10450 [Methylomonas lenta]
MKKNIYIECTELYLSQTKTGIQRVERNIIYSSTELSNNLNINIIPTIFIGKIAGLRSLKYNQQTKEYTLGYFEKVYLRSTKPNRLKKLTQACFPFLERFLEKKWVNYRLLFIPIMIITIPPIILVTSIYILLEKQKIKIKKNDIYFIPGSSWWAFNLEQLLKDINKAGARITVLLHDLVPITHPTLTTDQNQRYFEKRLHPLIKHADLIICISKYTSNTLSSYIESLTSSQLPRTEVNYSGFKLDLIQVQQTVRKEILFVNNTYISVGTIEPRKNYSYLLDAFELAWKQGIKSSLCIIGKYGWKSEQLVQRILKHPQYGKQLFWFNDLNDNELLYAYQHAKACVYPSIIEGFGLPLIEALSLKCPVLASDIPIFHEVGGDYCYYFSLENPNSLCELIIKVDSQGLLDNLDYLDSFKWPDWNQSTTKLLDILNSLD